MIKLDATQRYPPYHVLGLAINIKYTIPLYLELFQDLIFYPTGNLGHAPRSGKTPSSSVELFKGVDTTCGDSSALALFYFTSPSVLKMALPKGPRHTNNKFIDKHVHNSRKHPASSSWTD